MSQAGQNLAKFHKHMQVCPDFIEMCWPERLHLGEDGKHCMTEVAILLSDAEYSVINSAICKWFPKTD